MKNITRHTGKIKLIERLKNSKNGNPQFILGVFEYQGLGWTFRTPKRIREYAVKDILSCFKSGETRVKKKQIKKFIINNKKKKEHKKSISLPKKGRKKIDNN